jgi:hypothetical protein
MTHLRQKEYDSLWVRIRDRRKEGARKSERNIAFDALSMSFN